MVFKQELRHTAQNRYRKSVTEVTHAWAIAANLKTIQHSCTMTVLPLELDLYSDYLMVNQRQVSATRLAALLEGEFSHDAFTRKLTQLY